MSVIAIDRDGRHRGRRERSGEELIRELRRGGDPRLREQVIDQYLPLARKLARRFHRGAEPLEDLVQVASVGLLKAVDRFDPDAGNAFSSFAIPTITGELRRHFRDTTWSVHVPRGTQEAALRIKAVTDQLYHRHGRAPTVAEIAAETGLELEEVVDAMQARGAQEVASLDQPLAAGEEGDLCLLDVLGDSDDALELAEDRTAVRAYLRALPERERQVLYLRFVHELTQTQIAARLGCSQMQVSRLLRRAIDSVGAAVAADAAPR